MHFGSDPIPTFCYTSYELTIPSIEGLSHTIVMLSKLIAMPWRVSNELRRIAMSPFIWCYLRAKGIRWKRGWRISGRPLVQRHRGSRIQIGRNANFRSWRGSNPLVPYHPVILSTRTAQAEINIGTNCGLTGTRIVSASSITIGNNVLVGANVSIVDTDFHPLTSEERAKDMLAGVTKPIVIEDDVFIGMQSLIMKGVTIGKGSVIGAGSVVTRNIPSGVIAAGNPAKIIRTL